MVIGRIRFLASTIAPKPEEIEYWIDLSEDRYGCVIKCYNGVEWERIDQRTYDEIISFKHKLDELLIEIQECENNLLQHKEDFEEYKNETNSSLNTINEQIENINASLETLLGESASEFIDKYNEILNFLTGYEDTDTLQSILSDLKNEISQNITEIESNLTSHINNKNNPHNVTVSQIGAIPTGGLKTINGESIEGNGNIEVASDADNVIFTSDLVITADVGVHTIDASGSKTLPTTGKSIKQVMDLLFSEEKNPIIVQPSVNLTSTSMGSKEVGTILTPDYSATLNPGSYQFGPETNVTVSSWNITNTIGENKSESSGNFNQLQITDDTNYSITAVVQHTQGSIPLTNLGNEYSQGQIQEGSKSKTLGTITGHRKTFYGTVESKETLIDSSLIRELVGKSSNALANGSKFDITIPIGAIRIIIAYPSTLRDLTQVLDVNGFNAPIQSEFLKNKITVQVEGANAYEAIEYKVFYMDYASSNDTVNTYKVTI